MAIIDFPLSFQSSGIARSLRQCRHLRSPYAICFMRLSTVISSNTLFTQHYPASARFLALRSCRKQDILVTGFTVSFCAYCFLINQSRPPFQDTRLGQLPAYGQP
jgi:hypothetical protein